MVNVRDNGNEDIVSRTSTEMLFTFLCKSENTKEIHPYTISITSHEPLSYSKSDFLSSNYDINYVKSASGENVCTTVLDETDTEQDFNFDIKDDFVFINDNYSGFFRNVLISLLKGQSIQSNGDTIVMVGTNGTELTNMAKAGFGQINLPYKRLFDKEATRLKRSGGVLNGMPTFKNNSIINGFNRMTKTAMCEIKTVSGQGVENTVYIPYLKIGNITYDEGDVNSYSIESKRLCDVWERKDFVTERAEVKANEYTELDNEFEVNCIGYARPIVAYNGELVCVVDKSNGSFRIDEYKDDTWGVYTGIKKIERDTRIFGTQFIDENGKIFNQNCFIVSEKCNLSDILEMSFTRDEESTSTKIVENSLINAKAVLINGLEQYVYKVQHFNRDSKKFEPYTTIE